MEEVARRASAAGGARAGAGKGPAPSVAQAAVVFSVLAATAFAEGALLPRSWRLASIALLGLVAAWLVVRPRVALRRLDVALVAVFGALDAWTALSAAWSVHPAASLLQAERVLVYVAALLALFLLAERRALPQLLVGALAAITVVVSYALVRYVVAPPPLDRFEGRLLYQPYGYANALGIVAAIGILLSLGLTVAAGSVARRAAALAPLVVLTPALYLTSSRGAVVALVAGLVVAGCCAGRRRAVLVVGAVAAVVVTGLVAAALAVSTHQLTLARLAGENRPQYWQVAVEDFRAHPVLGSGAGSYGDYWLHYRPVLTYTRTAHSLYLQSLAELGPLGLALVLAALGLPLLALRLRSDPLVAAAAGGYVAYVVHTGIDWDWELPGVTLVGIVCGGVVLLSAGGTRRALATRTRALLLASALVLAGLEAVRLATGPATPFGY